MKRGLDRGKMNQKQEIKEFENMRNLAELRALSTYSLENPLNDRQYQRMMALKKQVFGGK